MDQRFNPYDSPGQQQRQQSLNSQMQEAIYVQRQRELQRDLQIRQMLLQEQLDHQQLLSSPLASSLQQQTLQQQTLQQQQRLYELQQFRQAGRSTMATLREEQMLLNKQREDQMVLKQQEQLRLYQLQQQQQQQHQQQHQQQQQQQQKQLTLQMQMAAAAGSDFGNEGLAGQDFAIAAPAQLQTSSVSGTNNFDLPSFQAQVRRNDPISREEFLKREFGRSLDSLDSIVGDSPNLKPRARSRGNSLTRRSPAPLTSDQASLIRDPDAREALEALMGKDLKDETALLGVASPTPPEAMHTMGTVDDLLAAAAEEEKAGEAANLMVGLKSVDWPDTESEEASVESVPNPNAISIELPGFQSTLPSLMEEPEYGTDKSLARESSEGENGKHALQQNGGSLASGRKATPQGSKTKGGSHSNSLDYPYPVDTWWPSMTTIRRERRMHAEKSDEEDFVDSPVLGEDSFFRADMATIGARLSRSVEPGVLEKIPHCKIHRQRMKNQKGVTSPEHTFCWQVTESYCNEAMVCCSVCSTWRHASCGGHYKPFSIRDTIMSETPFTPICDLCHEEQKLLESFPTGSARLERQRTEQLRRALQTCAVIRQASFAKHSGTYKWPLGSVSTTHIGGHTRSVHSRHDKAEKQWSEMAQKLGRGYGYRNKERTKVRTRELERLLVSVEDAEAYTDRHNMMHFLVHDIRKEHPAGFENRRLNLFDPEDDTIEMTEPETGQPAEPDQPAEDEVHVGRRVRQRHSEEATETSQQPRCARKECGRKPRFDSIFCSDACGLATIEADLLQSFYFAEDLHPAMLR